MPRLLEMSLVPPHSPPPFFDRCCVVAKVARAVPLASAALFSNDHSRADLPLACTGWLLVVNINQRLSRERSPPPVLLKPQHALRPVSATATAMLQLRCLERVPYEPRSPGVQMGGASVCCHSCLPHYAHIPWSTLKSQALLLSRI
jgi:hypothetical protein